jgi:hypothetical protein
VVLLEQVVQAGVPRAILNHLHMLRNRYTQGAVWRRWHKGGGVGVAGPPDEGAARPGELSEEGIRRGPKRQVSKAGTSAASPPPT